MTDHARRMLESGLMRVVDVLDDQNSGLSEYGSWEVAAVIHGSVARAYSGKSFSDVIRSSVNKSLLDTIWTLDESYPIQYGKPREFEDTLENFSIFEDRFNLVQHTYFNIFDPKGRFYHRRTLEDDLSTDNRTPRPGENFDIHLPYVNTLQAISTVIGFADKLTNGERSQINFAFRWNGLRKRKFVSWVHKERFFDIERTADLDTVSVEFDVQSDISKSKQDSLVFEMLRPLYENFVGHIPDPNRLKHARDYVEH